MSQWYLPEKVFGAIHLSVIAFSFHFFEVRIVGTSTPQHLYQIIHLAVQKRIKHNKTTFKLKRRRFQHQGHETQEYLGWLPGIVQLRITFGPHEIKWQQQAVAVHGAFHAQQDLGRYLGMVYTPLKTWKFEVFIGNADGLLHPPQTGQTQNCTNSFPYRRISQMDSLQFCCQFLLKYTGPKSTKENVFLEMLLGSTYKRVSRHYFSQM